MSSNNKLLEIMRYASQRGYQVRDDGTVVGIHGRALRLTWYSKYGYLHFSVRDVENRRRVLWVHRFAAYQWFGEVIFVKGIEVRHLDGNATNNKRENIALGTHAQNQMDVAPEKRRDKAIHAASHLRRFTDEEVERLRADRGAGLTYKEISEKHGGIAKSTLSYMLGAAVLRRATY